MTASAELRRPGLACVLMGLAPALVILAFMRIGEGQLMVAGQPLGEFDLNRLCAALLSFCLPILLLLPIAGVNLDAARKPLYWVLAFFQPALLLGPALLAGLLIGATSPGPSLIALGLLGVLLTNLTLWLETLRRFTGPVFSVMLYALAWAGSQFIGWFGDYVAPALENPTLTRLAMVHWLLPVVQTGGIDEFLQGGSIPWRSLAPVFVQIPVLAAALWLGLRREQA